MADEKALASETADRPHLTLIDSHCHIDMPEHAEKPVNRPDSDVSFVWFDTGLTIGRAWETSRGNPRPTSRADTRASDAIVKFV